MSSDLTGGIKNFNHYLWYQINDGIITIGINEDGLADITEINNIDLPPEQEKIEKDNAIGSIETDDGPLEIFTPADGVVIEVNSQVLEDPSIILEDPYEEGWLIRIEASEEIDEDTDEDDEDEDDDLDDEDLDEDADPADDE